MHRPRSTHAGLVGLFVGLAVLALAPGAIDNIDTRVCFRSAQALLDHGTFALQEVTPSDQDLLWAARGTDGAVHSKFGIGAVLNLIPFALVGRVAAALSGVEQRILEEFAISLSSPVFTGIAAALLFRILREHLGTGSRAALIGVVAWVFGTYQLSYSGSSYLETPLALAIVSALWFGCEARRTDSRATLLLTGVFAAWTVAIKAAAVICVPFVLVLLLTWDRPRLRRRLSYSLAPLGAAALSLMLFNISRFGHPLSTGYGPFELLFQMPLAEGLRTYMFEPDLALLAFAPALLLALLGLPSLVRRAPAFAWAAIGTLVSLVVLHARFSGPAGGTCYGPRYLLPAIAPIVAPGVAVVYSATTGLRRSLATGFLAICVVLQIPSAFVSPLEYHTIRRVVAERGRRADAVRPRISTDRRLLPTKFGTAPAEYDLAELIDDPSQIPEDRRYDIPWLDRGPAIWWVRAHRNGWPGALPLGIVVTAGAIAFGVRCVRGTRSEPPTGDVDVDV